MRAAAALIGACIENCAPCRRSLSGKLLEAEPIVLTVTIGVVFALHTSRGADAQDFAAQPAEVFLLVDRARAAGDDFRIPLATVERMSLADRAQLLDEALELWASYGRHYPHLIRDENLACGLLWSNTPVAAAMNARSSGRPDRAAGGRRDGGALSVRPAQSPGRRPSVPRHPSKESQVPMSERAHRGGSGSYGSAKAAVGFVGDDEERLMSSFGSGC
ncbi:hypothetical protein [Streptomyces sp. NPDC048643]|uniref:hypothetical protein n=1 Tax=Streptomyces sp. NPDC048643 TaxID=3155637 RepID=UPI0034287815